MATLIPTSYAEPPNSAESGVLRLTFTYLAARIDLTSVLPAALSAGLISESQRSDCNSDTNPFIRALKLVGHLQKAVDGDSKKFHTFVQILKETGHVDLALHHQC